MWRCSPSIRAFRIWFLWFERSILLMRTYKSMFFSLSLIIPLARVLRIELIIALIGLNGPLSFYGLEILVWRALTIRINLNFVFVIIPIIRFTRLPKTKSHSCSVDPMKSQIASCSETPYPCISSNISNQTTNEILIMNIG